MKTAAFTLSYWHTKEDADRVTHEIDMSLRHIKRICSPHLVYVACGTISKPDYINLGVQIVNAEVEFSEEYTCDGWTYEICAKNAAMWHFILNTDCDILLYLCSDGFLRHNIHDDLCKFLVDNNLIMAYNWCHMIDDAFYVMKRKGVIRYLNNRRRPNLSKRKEMLSEEEMALIFENAWFNPKPTNSHYRYPGHLPLPKYETVIAEWPMCVRPPADLRDKYAGHLL